MQQVDLIKDRIDEFFDEERKNNETLLEQLTLYIYGLDEGNETDLYILAKILPQEYLNKLINYCDGDSLKLPSKEEYRKKYLLIVCFYMKEILGYEWARIKKVLNLPENDVKMLSTISIGHQITKIKKSLNKDLRKMMEDKLPEDKLKKVLDELNKEVI